MTPRRRTLILTVLIMTTAAILGPAAYVGYQATIGGTWEHNQELDLCAATPEPGQGPPPNAEIGVIDKWRWWLPGHSHRCVYDLPDGRTIVRPVPS